MRDIFVPLFQEVDYGPQLDAAARLAPRLDAHVNVVYARPDAIMAAASAPDMLVAAGVVLRSIEEDEKIAQHSAIAQFEQWRIANRFTDSGETGSNVGATWHERIGSVPKTIAQVGRLSDLIVISRPEAYEVITDDAFTAALFDTGRPTLIAPTRIVDDPLEHVMVAWNGSLQAARAIDGAMPMLRIANRVSIFSVPARPDDLQHDLGLVEHLARHGILAVCLNPEGDTGDIGALLLQTAADEGVTMIVMGAYTHNRLREAILGGVTHHVLMNAEIPVLMMH